MSDTIVKERAVEGVTESLNRDAVIARASSEPEWLRERRLHAWDVYERTPMPSTRLEEWRYTDLSRLLHLDGMRLAEDPNIPDDPSAFPTPVVNAMDEDRAGAGHLVEVDGHVVHTDLSADLTSKGVVLASLHDAIEMRPELVERYLATEAVPPEEGKFQALNAALWTDGIFLFVPRGVRLELPVRVTRWT